MRTAIQAQLSELIPTQSEQEAASFSREELLRQEQAAAKKRAVARKNDPVTICCDCRELRLEVPERLKTYTDVIVQMEELEIGDYLLADGVAVERKEVHDFAASIKDHSLWDQLIRLRANFQQPIFLLEGDTRKLTGFNPRAIAGALSYISVGMNIHVHQTRNPAETSELLRLMAIHLQRGLAYQLPLRRSPVGVDSQRLEYVLCGIFEIGPVLAQRLLSHFGSLNRMFMASEEDLCAVDGVGAVRARALRSVIDATYLAPAFSPETLPAPKRVGKK